MFTPGGLRAPFFVSNLRTHLRSLGLMAGLVRIHAYKGGIFQLFDVPVGEARRMRQHLLANGFVISHTETV